MTPPVLKVFGQIERENPPRRRARPSHRRNARRWNRFRSARAWATIAGLKSWNHNGFAALSGRVTRSPDRGQASAVDAEDMIEQRTMDHRHKGSAALDEARLRQQAIGVKLRQMFDEVVNEPVPDEFLDILRRADRATGES